MKILMVCLGNICRSPLAEGILQHKVQQLGLNWITDSAGTSNYHIGEKPYHLSQKVAKLHGIDISYQRARQFVQMDMILFDKLYVMDSNNYSDVKRISGQEWKAEKVDLLLNELYPDRNIGVPDPWFGQEDGYHTVFEMIENACNSIIKRYANFNTIHPLANKQPII